MIQGASASEEERADGARDEPALNADDQTGACSSDCAVESKNTLQAVPTVEDMIEAVHRGDKDELQRLLAAGGQVNWVDDYGSTPLHCACFKCQPDCAEVLLKANALLHVTDMDGTPLHSACFHDSTACVQLLLAAKAAVNQTNSRDGETALHRACINGRDGIAKMLIDAGADATMLYRDKTPLQWAVERGKKNCQAVLQEEEKLAWARKLEAADRAAAALILEEEASSAAHGAAQTVRPQRRGGKAKKKARRRSGSASTESTSASASASTSTSAAGASGVSAGVSRAAEDAESEDEAYGSANGSSAYGHSMVGNSGCSSVYSNSGSSSAAGGRSGDASGAATACSPARDAHGSAHTSGQSGGQCGARPAEGHAARAPSLVDEALSAQRERVPRHGDGDGDGDGETQHTRAHGSQHEWQLPRRRNMSAAATRSHGTSVASATASAHSAPSVQTSTSSMPCARTTSVATTAANNSAATSAAATAAAASVPLGTASHSATSPISSITLSSAASESSDWPFGLRTHWSQNDRQNERQNDRRNDRQSDRQNDRQDNRRNDRQNGRQRAVPPTADERTLHPANAAALAGHSGSQHTRSQCTGGEDASRAQPAHGRGAESVLREREGDGRQVAAQRSETAGRQGGDAQSEESRAAAKARHIEEHAREFEALQMEAASRSHRDYVDAGEPDIPSAFICPITQELMEDPVCTVDGTTYDRAAISQWLMRHDTSPLTGARLATDMLIPIHVLRSQIEEFRELHGLERRRPAHRGV